MTQTTTREPNLARLRLAELQELAQAAGISGTSKMRKQELIDTLTPLSASRPARKQAVKDGASGTAAASEPTPSDTPRAPRRKTRSDALRVEAPRSEAPRSDREPETSAQTTEPRRREHADSRKIQLDLPPRTGGEGDRIQLELPSRGESDDDSRSRRRSRYRDRDRDRGKRRRNNGPDVETDTEIREDDVLMPVAGILDIKDNYAFVRTSGYLPGENDVYVAMNMVKRFALRKGDAITGAVRAPREGAEPHSGHRGKFNALVRLDSVNGQHPDQSRHRPDFAKLTPLYPSERLRLESAPGNLTTRLIDLVAPIGKGQRGLIVSPPKAGKTLVMQSIANAITANNPEVHLMVVLVDERPEEVTDFERTVSGEVISSTFDRPAEDHTTVAELAIERAKRLVELGKDVVVLLDGITRLGRAYNLAAPASGRILSGGVDSSALYPPKRFFGAARNIENGGSLTILATALIETGSKMDEVIFEEFKGTGNMELRLRRELADKRIFPAIDPVASGTRREELLMQRDELGIMWKLRRLMSGLELQQSAELLLSKLRETGTNVEFLLQVQKTTPIVNSRNDD